MIGRRKGTAAFVAVLAFLALASPAAAEWFTDLYAGAAITDKGNVDLTVDGEKVTVEDQEYKTSFVVGGRAGYWWSFFGVNLDVNYFRPEFDPDESSVSVFDPTIGLISSTVKTDLRTVGIGLNAMLRLQLLKDTTVPAGRLQPYIFAGPTVFISTLDVKGSVSVPGATATFDESDTSTKLGVTAGGGVTYLITNNIGLFGEYRFTHSKPEFEVFQNTLKLEPTLNTHHFVAGVSFRF